MPLGWGWHIGLPFFISGGLIDLPTSLLALQSVICATGDIDIWPMARVKVVGIVIFMFIPITSLEWGLPQET